MASLAKAAEGEPWPGQGSASRGQVPWLMSVPMTWKAELALLKLQFQLALSCPELLVSTVSNGWDLKTS